MNISDLVSKKQQQKSDDFTPATGWLNIVGTLPDGSSVSVGGIPIEGMKPMVGSSDFATNKNSLIQAILSKFSELESGQAVQLKLQVELRKVDSQSQSPSGNVIWDI